MPPAAEKKTKAGRGGREKCQDFVKLYEKHGFCAISFDLLKVVSL